MNKYPKTPQPGIIRTKAIVVAIATLVICTILFWFETSVAERVKAVETAWIEFSQESVKEEKALGNIATSFGYGGFIHNYKNYILRHDPELAETINSNLDSLDHGIKSYSSLNLSPEQLHALLDLKQVVTQYRTKFELAQSMVAEGKTPSEIDAMVKVDDGPALLAINFLSSQLTDRHIKQIDITEKTLQQTLSFQRLGRLILIPLVLITGGILIAFIRKSVLSNEALSASREQFFKIFDSSPDAMLITNSSGIIIQVNKKTPELLGYDEEELMGQSVEKLIPERYRDRHQGQRTSAFHSSTQRKIDNTREFSALKKDGTEISIDIGIGFYGSQSEKKAIVILRDITEKKLYEDMLERSQDVLKKAQSVANVGSWEWSIQDNTVKWSDEFFHIHGILPGQVEASYEKYIDFLHPEDRDKIINAINATVIYDKPFKIEHRIVRPDGEERVVMEKGEVFRNDKNEPLHMVCAVYDITERKQAESQLRLADNVFKHSGEGIIITDIDRKILRINDAFSSITGYSHDESIGKHPSELLRSGEHDNAFYQQMWRELNDTGEWSGEIIDRRKNGELFPTWHYMSAIKDEHGDVFQYISIFADITEKKRAEERIQYLAQYDQLTSLPNRALFHDRLQHALTRATRDNEKVGLMFIDLDGFKAINDTLGHQAGDQLLQVVADRLSQSVRAQDTVARLGGDEFTIILEDLTHREDAAIVADKVLASLRHPATICGEEVQPGCSIGISCFPEDGDTPETIIKHADSAMYEVKQHGKNRYQFYNQVAPRLVHNKKTNKT